jgi:Dolichyl-phosphate-mannose-protein mannosyltransferase
MLRKFIDRRWHIILWGAFAAVLVSFLYYFRGLQLGRDEVEHIHTAWKILQGQEIFVDFFQHHHPFFDYLLTPVIIVFGESTDTVFASRYFMLLFLAGIVVVTYLLALRLFKNPEIAIISLILTLTAVPIYQNSFEVRPDVPQSLGGLLSIYFLFVFFDTRRLISLSASALFLAVSFFFLQKSVFLAFIIGLLFLYDLYKRQIELREIFIYFAVFLLCISPYYIYLLLSGDFEQYIVTNWLVNIYYSVEWSQWPIVKIILKKNLALVVLFCIGFYIMMKSRDQRRFALLSLGLLITIIIFLIPGRRQYIMVAPLIAIVAAYGLSAIFNKRWVKLFVLILVISLPFHVLHGGGFFHLKNKKQSRQLNKINYVLSITNENDMVYDGKSTFNLYRNDLDYFWFCLLKDACLDAYRELTGYEYDIYDLIATQKPKVISTYVIDNLEDERIKNNYRPSDSYDDLLIRKD